MLGSNATNSAPTTGINNRDVSVPINVLQKKYNHLRRSYEFSVVPRQRRYSIAHACRDLRSDVARPINSLSSRSRNPAFDDEALKLRLLFLKSIEKVWPSVQSFTLVETETRWDPCGTLAYVENNVKDGFPCDQIRLKKNNIIIFVDVVHVQARINGIPRRVLLIED